MTGLVSIDVRPRRRRNGADHTPPGHRPRRQSFGLSVSAEGPFGNLDPTFNGNVTIAPANNPSGGILGGTTTVQAVNGVTTLRLTLTRPAAATRS